MQPQSPDDNSINPTPGGQQDTSIKFAQNAVNGAHRYVQPGIDNEVPLQVDASVSGVSANVIGTPGQAGDNDQIEKEWVEVIKKTLIDTRDDPFAQSNALARLRADYMKKRYNKDIKIPGS